MSTAGPWALSLDAIFELLCRRRRRYALYALYRNGENGMGLDGLTSRVRQLEAEDRDSARDGIREELRDRHVPKLVEAHVVDYDDRTDTIRYRGQPSLEEWIEHAEFKEGKRPEP
ncbi:hypothetical protein [Halalkalicoccus sp. NIPERK01]|uniref:DUF7344 domain-containing protein n=1 Tax=Halalkalicoccus sp. NIPERK01 TaxID=3053469 RepID=UPI00256F0F9F|nr:hypothetical protein [Halalkalicoccus sp. NIPERK01]MDL5361597.1 hypothetical protein [Halalkalicoccus sp. NIPERK01]